MALATQHYVLARLDAAVTAATARLARNEARVLQPGAAAEIAHREAEVTRTEEQLATAEAAYDLALKAAAYLDANPLGATPTASALETYAALWRLLQSLDPGG
jgi:hypothetical protein